MRTKIISIFLILCFCTLIGSPVLADNTSTSITTTRLAGQTRYETAKVISEQHTQGKVQNVILSTGNGFADALSASVLAHEKDAPILLVDTSVERSVDAFNYITLHLNPTGTVYIIGGTGIIGKEFDAKLNGLGFSNIVRIAGIDRYETSYQLAQSLNNTSVSTVIISSGESYPDALSIASFAGYKGWPILLTPQNALPQEMKKFLLEKKPSKVYITGGTGVISENVKSEVIGLLPQANIERLAGQDRFDTNASIAQTFKPNPSTIYLATGYGFADALAGSVLAAKYGDPIIFVDSSTPTLPKSVANYFGKLYAGKLSPNLVVFGGSGVVSDEVLKNSSDLISGVVQENSIYSIDSITATVTQNQAYPLPTTVAAKLYNSDTINVPVKWEPSTVDTSAIGTSAYEGVVDGYSRTISLTVNVEQVDDGSLARVRVDGKYGFINKSGKFVFYLDKAELALNGQDFGKGLIPVTKTENRLIKYGFLDYTGNVAIPLKYDACDTFKDGVAAVQLNRKWGFVDKSGNEVIPIQYYFSKGGSTIQTFSEGMIRVSSAEVYLLAKYGYIDLSGKLVIPYIYGSGSRNFREGLAAVQLSNGNKWGFIDKNGNEVVPLKYDAVEDFSEGLAAVYYNKKWGFVDTNGREVIPPIYDMVREYSEGLAAVTINNKWGFIDKSGNEVVPLKYDKAFGFQEGSCVVGMDNGMLDGSNIFKYGYIDKTGNEIIPLKYASCGSFKDGLASVMLQARAYKNIMGMLFPIGKWGVINKNEKIIIPFKYEHIYSFSEGFARVDNIDEQSNVGKYGFIDKTGKEVIPLIYDDATDFKK